MSEASAILHADRQKAIQRRHPWVFSGAIMRVDGSPSDGDIVAVRSEAGEFLARGYWNGQSMIRVRLMSWVESETIDEAYWQRKLEQALNARHIENRINAHGTANAYRLANAENDGLPGLIVDRYGDWLAVQALSLGVARRKDMLAALLVKLLNPAGIYERSDVDMRVKEGLPPETGLLTGKEPPELIEIDENGRRFLVDIRRGHKTGF